MPKESTRDALLSAARAEFAAHGIAGARVDRIAERAGVNKERIYGYFGSKDKLFDQVMTAVMDELTAAVAMPGDDPVEYVAKLYDYYRTHPELTRLLMWESLHYRDGELEGQEHRVAKCAVKAESLATGLGREPSQETARTMMTLIGLAGWPMVMSRLGRIILGDEAVTEEGRLRMREHLVAFARAALGGEPDGARPAPGEEPAGAAGGRPSGTADGDANGPRPDGPA
ncbi:TetR/AcrR family transcriptional regulator [Streptosporangium sandarakinum]|uniref:TetR/AcrR family transcriptional regulator n=1 Tax=Streptosporangium sandarakinum TaxID=1260955 RepID=UPI003434B745